MVDEAEEILRNSRGFIKREIVGFLKRIEYLEGKEFYDEITKDLKQQHYNIVAKLQRTSKLKLERELDEEKERTNKKMKEKWVLAENIDKLKKKLEDYKKRIIIYQKDNYKLYNLLKEKK